MKHQCQCSKCGKVTEFSCGGWRVQCTHCGGWFEPIGRVLYACAHCGNGWSSETDRDKVCPECNSLDIVCTYEEDGVQINQDVYKDLLAHIELNERFTYSCKCGSQKSLYSAGLYNVACNSCSSLMGAIPDEYMRDKLKAYREAKGWSQAELARRYAISRSYVAAIEAGRKPLPPFLLKLVKN